MKRNFLLNTLLLILTCIISTGICAAQTTVSGIIIGKNDGKPVAGAYVFIKHEKTITSFAFSKEDGYFNLKCPEIGKDSISVTIIGYKPVTLLTTGKNMKIQLSQEKMTINASKVSASAITEKGDTVSYLAGAFRDKNDRVLADILKKIPGLAVTESGGITHNGSHIGKFYVEGLDLMGSQYGVITKNLSANDIAKVEIYKNHQPVKVLKGVQNTDKSAVNIILKETAKNSWLFNGDIAAGYGKHILFDARAMVTRFAKTNQDLYLLKGNNDGTDISKELHEQQYFGKIGGFLVSNESFDALFISSLNPRRTFLEIPKQYWYNNITGLASFNHLEKISETVQNRTSLHLASEKYHEQSMAEEVVFLPDNEGQISITDGTSMNDDRHYISLKSNLEKNSSGKFLSEELSISGQWRTNHSSADGASQDYNQKYRLPSFKIGNILKSTIKISQGKMLDISSNSNIIFNNHSAKYRIEDKNAGQTVKEFKIKSDNRISRIFKIKRTSINAYSGLRLGVLRRESNLDLDYNLDYDIENRCKMTAADINPFIGMSARFSIGKSQLYISLPGSLDYMSSNLGDRLLFPSFSPYAEYKARLNHEIEFQSSAGYSIMRSGIETLSPAVTMDNYRTFSYKDRNRRSDKAFFNISMNYSNNLTMFYATIKGNGAFNKENRTSSSYYAADYTVTSFVPARIDRRYYSTGMDISKYFGMKTLVIDASCTYSWDKSGEYLQQKLIHYSSRSIHANAKLRTYPVKWLRAEVSADYYYNAYNGSKDNGTKKIKSSGRIDISLTKNIEFHSEAWHLLVKTSDGQTIIQEKPLIKAGMNIRISKFEIFAECRNLLGISEFSNRFATPRGITSRSYKLRGREFMAGIRLAL